MPQGCCWTAGVREDLISRETFCTLSEASVSHLDVEGHESLARALPMVAHTKQGPDATAQSFSDFCLHKSSVIFTLPETLSAGKKNQVALIPHVELTLEWKPWFQKDVIILLPKNREAHKRVFTLGLSGGGRINQVYKELQ